MIPRWNSLRRCKHGKLASLGRPSTAAGVSAEESERCDNSALGISAPTVGGSGIPAIAAMRVTGEAKRAAFRRLLGGFGRSREDKLCLGDHCYELAIGGGDPRLPDHGS